MIKINDKRFLDNFFGLAKIGWSEAGLNRPSYSSAYAEGRDYVKKKMEDAGMKVRVDTIGNIYGRYDGTDPTRRTVLVGSHLDSVPNGGIYDGALGVLGGIEALQSLHEEFGFLAAPIEVIGFIAEEAGLFGGTFGSRAITGLAPLKQPEEAFKWSGLTCDDLVNARIKNDGYGAYLELHIEQGPVLERKNLEIGIPTGIVSIIRYKITMNGQQNHAGTTPMSERKNAMRPAVELLTRWFAWADERLVKKDDFVYNTGVFILDPNSPAVVPGKASFVMELRSLSDKVGDELVAKLHEMVNASEYAAYSPTIEKIVNKAPVALHENIIATIEQAVRKCGYAYQRMPSGASHDAVAMAHFMPTGMIFVKSHDGISHNKAEFTANEDMLKGVQVLTETVALLAE